MGGARDPDAPAREGLGRHPGRPWYRAAGSAWLSSSRTALLAVPSVIIVEEDNVLINPAHPDAKRIAAIKARRFVYDRRI